MKELEDKDFDQIFKKKITDGYLDFEEESWLKMEKKLRKRDRFVFYRNASILLLLLSVGMGIYLMREKKMPTSDSKLAKKVEKIEREVHKSDISPDNTNGLTSNIPKIVGVSSKNRVNGFLGLTNVTSKPTFETPANPIKANENQGATISSAKDEVIASNSILASPLESKSPERIETLSDVKINVARKPRPITLSFNVGPDFSSTENTIGGKSGATIGVGINVPISSKLSMQTGVNYGTKNYEAKGYDYTFNNPNTVNVIAGIDASCKVLEIPLRASYTVGGNHKNSLDVNAGFSSYIMLKENYRFMYTAAANRNDRLLEEKNANQHYFSVIDLSATYNIKLKNRKFALGLEPYVKIPISGIGEGNVPLKSSGISLKLNYEFSKK